MAAILSLFVLMANSPTARTVTTKSANIMVTNQSSPNGDAIKSATSLHNRIFGVYVGLLVLTVIGTYLVWWSGNNVQDTIQADANRRIAEAQHQTEVLAQANISLRSDLTAESGKVAGLQKQASDAKAAQQKVEIELAKQQERTAEAIRLAEQEKIARLRIEERLAYRNITAEQVRTLKMELQSLKGERVTIFTSGMQPEVNEYAKRLTEVLKDAGLDAIFQPALLPTSHTGFLFVSGEARLNAAESILAAFVKAGLAVGRIPLQIVPQTNELQIIVGPKE